MSEGINNNKKRRKYERRNDELRRFSVLPHVLSRADGSVVVKLGNTIVLCSVSLQDGVPRFMRGTGKGWLTAEYSMLPTATKDRKPRDSSQWQKNGRSVEISRIIGRVFRTALDTSALGEKTITIDCDVLCADGGTRTASIIGASLALQKAEAIWIEKRNILRKVISERIAAISVGVSEDTILVDPDYEEDTLLDADFNFIMTESGTLIEIQGGAEKKPLSWECFDQIRSVVCKNFISIFALMDAYLSENQQKNRQENSDEKSSKIRDKTVPLFSLKNRLSSLDINQ